MARVRYERMTTGVPSGIANVRREPELGAVADDGDNRTVRTFSESDSVPLENVRNERSCSFAGRAVPVSTGAMPAVMQIDDDAKPALPLSTGRSLCESQYS